MTGAGILPNLPAIAALRIAMFREFPYLYDGDMEYEQKYLAKYMESKDAAVIAVFDDAALVGVSTCLPLRDEAVEIQRPFNEAIMDLAKIFYFSESVLLPAYRGQGIGVAFFAAREAQARATGHGTTAFCAVQRPAEHPLRPKNHVPLDRFWERRGYRRQPQLVCEMSWRDVHEPAPSSKRLTFWTKDLRS